jgi:hypothetical protein
MNLFEVMTRRTAFGGVYKYAEVFFLIFNFYFIFLFSLSLKVCSQEIFSHSLFQFTIIIRQRGLT